MVGEGSRVTAIREQVAEAQPRPRVIGAVDQHRPSDRPPSRGFPVSGGAFCIAEIPVHPLRAPVVQAKLFIGEAGDPLEREADEVAAAVLDSDEDCSSISCAPANWRALQRVPISPYDDEDIQVEPANEAEEEEAEMLQTKAFGASTSGHGDMSAGLNALRGGGSALPGSLRSLLEPRFGYDFGKVRVHDNGEAAHLAASLNARAFTSGRDIVFGGAQFSPETIEGRRLLAHELTHVVQQGQAGRLPVGSQAIGEPCELMAVSRDDHPERIRRVRLRTGRRIGRYRPWPNERPNIWGDEYDGQTDGGSSIHIWRPDNRTTFWCHGYTFGGAIPAAYRAGGPFSVNGVEVPRILRDDGWHYTSSSNVRAGDILVFTGRDPITHTGIITRVERNNGQVDESRSMLSSKWGYAPLSNVSWLDNAGYGRYWCYSRRAQPQPGTPSGTNECRETPPTGESRAGNESTTETPNTDAEPAPENRLTTDGGGNAD